jgi:phospholipid/cholesterol/gamma-HCH transport system substrate-binding protein
MSRVARLGAFIIGTLAILAAGIFVIGSHEYLFRSTYRLQTQFDNVAGLQNGADIEVGGVHSGIVRAIQLPNKPGGRVDVVMDLNKSTRNIIKQDSVASIETEGLLGSQFIAITFGSANKPDVKDGDSIGSTPPLMMSDMMVKANGILTSGQEAAANVDKMTANLQQITVKVNSGVGTAGALVNDKQLYNNMNKTMSSAQSGVSDFQEDMEALKHNFLLSGYFKKRGYENDSDLQQNAVDNLPNGTAIKTFTISGKDIFDKVDSAKMKNGKALKESGEFLANSQYGVAVVAVTTGPTGDSQKDLLLTQARAMVVRDYLVSNFGFDDSTLKTIGMGKQTDTAPNAGKNADWGTVQILIYPEGTAVPTAVEAQKPAAATPPAVKK